MESTFWEYRNCRAPGSDGPCGARPPSSKRSRGGWVPIDEACVLYNISIDEFIAWERDLDRYGVHGLRTTRYQIYRETEKKSA
jgi:uncharacterized protein DUF1153